MYSPVMSEKTVKTIYRLKRVYKKPMTEIAESLIRQSLKNVAKDIICEACFAEKNDDCKDCYLNDNE